MTSIVTSVGDATGNPTEMKAMDANRYATKKTIAQGMLDIALLTANASQLRYILQVGERHEFYKLMLVLISASIIMQVLSGVLSLSLTMLRDCRMHLPQYHRSADFLNHVRTGFAFFTTIINLFISAFDNRPEPLIMIVGILFVVIGSLNINRKQDQTAAIILNDVILVVIFIISLTNVIISGFGIEYSSQPLIFIEKDILTGILLVMSSLVSLHKSRVHRILADHLNHLTLGFIFLSLFCDIIKMNFGLNPAFPLEDKREYQNFQNL